MLQVKNSDGLLSPYEVKSFQQGRRNQGAFEVVLERMGPPVVGTTLFRSRLRQASSDDELWTSSDEAFVYLVLENTYDRWVDILKHKEQGGGKDKSLGTERRWLSDVATKYTEGGLKFSSNAVRNKRGQTKGWSDAGLKRYNRLFLAVKRDRLENPKPFQQWIQKKRDAGIKVPNTKQKRRRKGVVIKTDLFRRMGVQQDVGMEAVDEDDYSSEEGSSNTTDDEHEGVPRMAI